MNIPHLNSTNGRLKKPALVQTKPTAKLNYHLASNFREMSIACKRETGHRLNVRRYGSYRSRALQALMRRFPRLYGVMAGIVQAPVGFSSHGWGDSIDVESDSLTFIQRFGAAWGWHHTIPGDTYHFQYTGRLVGNKPPHGK